MNELVLKVENGKLVCNIVEVDAVINTVIKALDDAKKTEEELRKKLLEAMMATGTLTLKLPNYTVSQVLPKKLVEFNHDEFVRNESGDLITAFTEKCDDGFDVTKFKNENPELYKKYCTPTFIIDYKRLSKVLPDVYNKYAREYTNPKPATIMIKGVKKEVK